MANMPDEVKVRVTAGDLAEELEALAVSYEEVINKIRYEADRLRQGYELTLHVTAVQSLPKAY